MPLECQSRVLQVVQRVEQWRARNSESSIERLTLLV